MEVSRKDQMNQSRINAEETHVNSPYRRNSLPPEASEKPIKAEESNMKEYLMLLIAALMLVIVLVHSVVVILHMKNGTNFSILDNLVSEPIAKSAKWLFIVYYVAVIYMLISILCSIWKSEWEDEFEFFRVDRKYNNLSSIILFVLLMVVCLLISFGLHAVSVSIVLRFFNESNLVNNIIAVAYAGISFYCLIKVMNIVYKNFVYKNLIGEEELSSDGNTSLMNQGENTEEISETLLS